jgi:hypothetical protein
LETCGGGSDATDWCGAATVSPVANHQCQ